MITASPASLAGNAPQPSLPPQGEVTSWPPYLLEMARTFSIEFHSEPVLCMNFLPWMDLAISAAGDICSPAYSSPMALLSRFHEVSDRVEGTQQVLQVRTEWCRSLVSFGLVRWWPVSVRERASRALGPFKVVIDCPTGQVQIHKD